MAAPEFAGRTQPKRTAAQNRHTRPRSAEFTRWPRPKYAPDGCAGARKNYTYAIDNPAPEPDTPTELIAVSLNRNDGFVLKSWTGNCAYFDANGNYLGMLPATLPEDPDDWITDDTIYVKCLKAQPTQMASAMTDMAVLAGASMEGAVWSDGNYNFEFFEPINGCLIANLMRGCVFRSNPISDFGFIRPPISVYSDQ